MRNYQPYHKDKQEVFERILSDIALLFNEKWLNKGGKHPLQILWNRPDYLASEELFFLALVYKLQITFQLIGQSSM